VYAHARETKVYGVQKYARQYAYRIRRINKIVVKERVLLLEYPGYYSSNYMQ